MKNLIILIIVVNMIFTISIIGQTILVDNFGAVGDGVTDDRAAIQSALNDLKANGGELQFTSGSTYIISGGLQLYHYSNIRTYHITTTGIEKATILIADNTPMVWGNWGMRIYNSPNITISNLAMDGNRATRNPEAFGEDPPPDNYLIQVERKCDGMRLENLLLENGVVDNLYITADEEDESTYMTDFEMYNCVLTNGYRNNMSVIRGMNFKIVGCEFSDAIGAEPEAGIDFEPNPDRNNLGYTNMLVEGCTFRNNRRFGILLTHRESDCGNSTIKNNYFYNNGILIASVNNIIRNNIFRGMDHSPIIGADPEQIRDGIIYFHTNHTSVNNKVFNNYFFDNSMPADNHLIHLMSNSGGPNEIYDNYSNNNIVAGFVSNLSNAAQDIHDNDELSNREMGYWSMDASTITGTSISDLSDFEQTGILHNNPTLVPGIYNEALDFTPDNKYIDITVEENLNIEINITLLAWVKWDGANAETQQIIIGREDDWRFGINSSGKLGFYAPNTGDTSYTAAWTSASSPFPEDEWSLVAATYDGMRTKIYIDGVEKVSEQANREIGTSSPQIYIGSFSNNTYSFNGSIDDAKIYNYALSGTEIADIFNETDVLIETKIFLEGAYNSASSEMNVSLTLNNDIPLTSPYTEDVRTVTSIPTDVVDWILVELRETSNGNAVVSKSAFLHKDGRIVADDGTTESIKLSAPEGNFFIVIKHRNHLAIMSANTVPLNSTTSTLYDFTIGSEQYYGIGGAKQIEE